jgi:tetratricopeptide (TPR) repeat protein
VIGEQVNQYRILSLIGSGGMGVVYKADDTRLKRPVALKFLQKELVGDAASKERFINEARAASSLDHPNICTIYDIGEKDDGQLFIAMRYYEGETLRARLRRAPVPPAEARSIVMQLAGALGAAHARGIIHRDIKPDNVFLTADGVVKILDFGLAKLERLAHDPDTLSASGTVAYMAPEQLRGEVADARADIWSLGILLFEMLTQRLPFQGYIHAAMMYSILNEEAEDLVRILPGVPDALNSLYRECVRKDRAMRPGSAADILGRLVTAQASPGAAPVRSPRRAVLVAGVAIATLVVALALWLLPSKRAGLMTPREGRIPIAVLPFTITGAQGPDSLRSSEYWQGLFITELSGNDELNIAPQIPLNALYREEFPDRHALQIDEHFSAFLQDNGLEYAVIASMRPMSDSLSMEVRLIAKSLLKPYVMTLPIGKGVDPTETVKTLVANTSEYFHIKAEMLKDPSIGVWATRGSTDRSAQYAFLQGYYAIVQGGSGEKGMREAIRYDSTFIAAHVFLISALLNKGRIEDVKAEFAMLQRLEPHAKAADQVLIRYARALIADNREEQIRSLEELLRDNEANFVLMTTLAAMKYFGKPDITTREYRKTLDMIRPVISARWRNPLVYGIAAECYFRMGEKDSVYALVENNAPAGKDLVSLAIVAVLKKRDGATSVVNNVLKDMLFICDRRELSVDEGLVKIATLMLRFNDTSFAADLASQALAANEANAAARVLRGNIALRRGRVAEAMTNFTQALYADRDAYEAHFGLGEIYSRQGNTVAALKEYKRFREFETKSEEADTALARIRQINAQAPSLGARRPPR